MANEMTSANCGDRDATAAMGMAAIAVDIANRQGATFAANTIAIAQQRLVSRSPARVGTTPKPE